MKLAIAEDEDTLVVKLELIDENEVTISLGDWTLGSLIFDPEDGKGIELVLSDGIEDDRIETDKQGHISTVKE